MVLASAGGSQSLEELADLVDKVMDVAAPAVTQINTQLSSNVDQLCSEISDLKLLFKSMHLPKPSFNRRPSKSPRCPPSPAPRRTQLPSNLCWYHHCFGDDAKMCQLLYTWTGNEQASQ